MIPFTQSPSAAVSAWGEEKLIRSIQKWLGEASPKSPFGIGDDCAVLPPSRSRQLITVDPVIYGRHFDDSIPARAVGEKLLKRNLSDLAAMGGRPTAAVLALTLDSRTSRAWLEQFYRGLSACARQFDVPVVGGDLAQADGVIVASLTLLGVAAGSRVVTRTGARVGDWIYVTGVLGDSLATGHHYRFAPRLAEGAWLARHADVRAMMDVSDGIAKDVHALTPARAKAAIDPASVPLWPGSDLRAALSDGEDYELLFVLRSGADRSQFAQRWRRAFPRVRLSSIGQFVSSGELSDDAVRLEDYHGYEHLR